MSGFLLIEAMIATVILAVAAMGIVSLLLTAHQQQMALQENSTAVLLAKQLMEEITAKPFGSVAAYNGYHDTTASITTLGGETISPGDGQVYARKVTVGNAPTPPGSTAPAADLQLVTVTIIMPSGASVSLSKLMTNVTW